MKFGIVYRVGLALALIGVLASGLTGYYGYAESRKLLIAAAKERLLIATRVLNRQLAVGLESTARDVQMLALHPQAARLLNNADPANQAQGENNAALLFEGMLNAHPEYFQMRMIGAAEHGLERIRVDRIANAPVRIGVDELQEKGHYPYVFETLALPPGAVYLSNASINHEAGSHASLEQPTLQVAAPVYDATGAHRAALGVVVINVDLRGLFAQLARDLPADVELYLANAEGEFLINPDPVKAFAFDRGQQALVQADFPATARLLQAAAGPADDIVTTASIPGQGAVVAAFVRDQPTNLSSTEAFILGLSLPLRTVLRESDHLGEETLRIVFGFSALAVLLAILLARALTRPLNAIVAAVRDFPHAAQPAPLPCRRRDEIGVLARSIADMQQQIRTQMSELTEQQQALDRLASYDSLTGLPNRRLFFERLERALARARRNQGGLSLLFIDLDDFKQINDSHGHGAGDAVLCAAARRLEQRVRETDTVARLGGDEFVVLIDSTDDPAAVGNIVRDILAALAQPIAHQGANLLTGASIGVSLYPRDGDDAEELIAAADKAMYRAKTRSGEQACFTDDAPGA